MLRVGSSFPSSLGERSWTTDVGLFGGQQRVGRECYLVRLLLHIAKCIRSEEFLHNMVIMQGVVGYGVKGRLESSKIS